ncbi:Homeobox protein yox1 [Elasticomyces elasticus]|nr:Homeobox protein yox1 [Elasticomyces elasticus]
MESSGSAALPATSVAESSSSPVGAEYAFLVHSQSTLPNNLPPDVDNKPLARQKRRRTSPEDQAILEAEYLRNPKPDKQARIDIVSRVALGEKEVQIWFQNRRQNSRRKSRPLLPHEIDDFRMSFSEPSGIQFSSDTLEKEEQVPEHLASDGTEEPEGRNNPVTRTAGKVPESQDTVSSSHVLDSEAVALSSQQEVSASQDVVTQASSIEALLETSTATPLQAASQENSKGLGYLANRRSASFAKFHSELEEAVLPEALGGGVEDDAESGRILKKASSFVRLSMTSDGKARVVTKESSSPSPPHSQPNPNTLAAEAKVLQRSHSTASLNDRFMQVQQTSGAVKGLRRSTSGRSRDSRAWEFWCDKDARTELEEKAEQERSGSAADAIGLLRSQSGRRVPLASVSNKRNIQPDKQESAKRLKPNPEIPQLQRASSSFGRLQSKSVDGRQGTVSVRKSNLKRAKSSATRGDVYIPYNDSDKENWSPERTRGDHAPGKSPAKQPDKRSRRVLGESPRIPAHSSSLGALMRREKVGRSPVKFGRLRKDNAERPGPEEDEEVAEFMGVGRKSTSASEEEDLDCVQGLLSLSQGNWK